MATAIKIGDPASWDRAVKTIRETDGVVTAVSDEEILEAKAVIDGAGVGCEPASAASVAGTRQLRERGVIRHEDRVVAVLTGHVLKDPGALMRYHQETEPPPRYATGQWRLLRTSRRWRRRWGGDCRRRAMGNRRQATRR